MAISGPIIASQILASSPGIAGPVGIQLSQAIGNAVALWAVDPASVVLVGVVSGATGGGSVVGTRVVMPPVSLPVSASLYAFLRGPIAAQMAAGIGVGIATAMSSSALYTGVATGAIGSDVSKIVYANPSTLIQQLIVQMQAVDIRGPVASELASGLGIGISTMFLSGLGFGLATGVGGPTPGIGVSKSSLL